MAETIRLTMPDGKSSAITIESGAGTINLGFIRPGVIPIAIRLPRETGLHLAEAIMREIANG